MAGTIVAVATTSGERSSKPRAASRSSLTSASDSIGWKPAMRARPDASNQWSGPPAGTWNARPAGMTSRLVAADEGQLALDHEAPVRLRCTASRARSLPSRSPAALRTRRPSRRAWRSGGRGHPGAENGDRQARHACGGPSGDDDVWSGPRSIDPRTRKPVQAVTPLQGRLSGAMPAARNWLLAPIARPVAPRHAGRRQSRSEEPCQNRRPRPARPLRERMFAIRRIARLTATG